MSSKPQNRCFKVLLTLFIQLSKDGDLEKARILVFPSVKTTETGSLGKQIFVCEKTWNEIVNLSVQYTRQTNMVNQNAFLLVLRKGLTLNHASLELMVIPPTSALQLNLKLSHLSWSHNRLSSGTRSQTLFAL